MDVPPRWVRLAAPVALVVLTLAGAGLARASLDELAAAQTLLAPAAGLLGPIDAGGRTGWDCPPERTARASTVRGAELPDESGR
jgi:hypothetical protein